MQTAFRQIPKNKTAGFSKESAAESLFPKPKINLAGLFIVLIIIGLAGVYLWPEGKNQEEYFQELQNRKETGQYLTSGEKADFCELLFLLRDSVSTECVGILDGINWDNPPLPDNLGENWEELPAGKAPNTRKFRHKTFKKIQINFDDDDPDAPKKAHRRNGHWHRLNPNSTSKKDRYLDKFGKPVRRGTDETHIHIRK